MARRLLVRSSARARLFRFGGARAGEGAPLERDARGTGSAFRTCSLHLHRGDRLLGMPPAGVQIVTPRVVRFGARIFSGPFTVEIRTTMGSPPKWYLRAPLPCAWIGCGTPFHCAGDDR